MSILASVLATILLIFQALPVHSHSIQMQPFVKLNDAVTNEIKRTMEELADSSNPEAQASFWSLQKAAELPFLRLDEKIMAYNNYQKGYGARNNPELEANADDPNPDESDEVNAKPRSKSFEKKVTKLLKKLGMKNDFADRVWKAILCDPKKLKQLKKKLAQLSDSDECDYDYGIFNIFLYGICEALYDFITSLWKG